VHDAVTAEAAGATQVELEVIDRFRTWLGMPTGTAGVPVTGGSAANLPALLAEALVRSHAGLTLMAPATLEIVCSRRESPGCDETETERRITARVSSALRARRAALPRIAPAPA